MMGRQVVIPAKGASVLNEKTGKPLDEKGDRVIWTPFWERRLADKSITLGKGPIKDMLDEKAEAIKIKKENDAKAAEAKAKAEEKAAKEKAKREKQNQAANGAAGQEG